MLKTIMILVTTLFIAALAGCTAGDRITDKVFLSDFESEQGEVGILTSDNIATRTMAANNITGGTLRLNALPTADPGISGMVWSDNGTLRISP